MRVEAVLHGDVVAEGTEVVADVRQAGGLDAGEDASAAPGSGRALLVGWVMVSVIGSTGVVRVGGRAGGRRAPDSSRRALRYDRSMDHDAPR